MKMKEEKMSQGNEFISRIRSDFPLIKNHPEIAYLDNAATSQKPLAVLLRLSMRRKMRIRSAVSTH